MIQINNISYSYIDNEVIKDIIFQIMPGDCVAVLANNGSGKSTLITCLNKIRTPDSGEVYMEKQDLLKMGRLDIARSISYVAQNS